MGGEADRTGAARRAVLSLPKRLRVAAVGQLAAGAALLLWAFWSDPAQRYVLLMGCLGLAAAALCVLARARKADGPLDPGEVARAVLGLPGSSVAPAPLPAVLPRDVRGRLWARFVKLCLAGWGLGFLLLVIGSPVPPPQVREIREAGGVVAEARIAEVTDRESRQVTKRGNKFVNDPKAGTTTDRYLVEVRDAAGTLRRIPAGPTTFAQLRPNDGKLKVIYAPGATHLGAYVGPDSRRPNDSKQNHLGPFTGYQSDLERILTGRALSDYQLGIAGALWAVILVWFALSRPVRPRGRLPAGGRALHGTNTDWQVRDPDSGVGVTVRPVVADDQMAWSALEGRRMWVCWDPAKQRELYPSAKRRGSGQKGRPEPYAVASPALLILDDGWSVPCTAHFPRRPRPTDPATMGVEAGSLLAPVDEARTVRAWDPSRTWPLTLTKSHFVSLSLALLASGVLFTDLVSGIPRLIVGALGLCFLVNGCLRDVRAIDRD